MRFTDLLYVLVAVFLALAVVAACMGGMSVKHGARAATHLGFAAWAFSTAVSLYVIRWFAVQQERQTMSLAHMASKLGVSGPEVTCPKCGRKWIEAFHFTQREALCKCGQRVEAPCWQ